MLLEQRSGSKSNIKAYQWDFGDRKTAAGNTLEHRYEKEGNYTIKLTVIDDNDLRHLSAAGNSGYKIKMCIILRQLISISFQKRPLLPKTKFSLMLPGAAIRMAM